TYYGDIAQLVVGGISLSTDTGAAATVGTHTITATGGTAANYCNAIDVNGTLTVTPRLVTATADAKTKIFGASDPALSYQITSGTLAYSDTFSGSLSRASGESVGTYAIQKNTLSLSSNYTFTYVGAN